MDGMLFFGLQSAPKILIQWQLHWNGAWQKREYKIYMHHYLDDFPPSGPPVLEQCSHILQSVCIDLGIPLVVEKHASPGITIEFPWITNDTSQQELYFPNYKLRQLQSLLEEWNPKSHVQDASWNH